MRISNFNYILSCLLFLTLCSVSVKAGSEARFEQNKGQWPSAVKYRVEIPSGALFLEKNQLTWNLIDPKEQGHHHETSAEHTSIKSHAFRMQLSGSSSDSKLSSENQLNGYSNYFIGKAANWAGGVLSYEKVRYTGIYSGIDWLVYSSPKGIKYDFELKADADPSQIKLIYSGVEGLHLKQGELIIPTEFGIIKEEKPVAWQIIHGKKVIVDCKFRLNNNEVGFELGKYDSGIPLLIDPQLVFGSFSGSSADNWGFTATYDNAGNTYSAGVVFGIGYPTSVGVYQQNFGNGTGSRPCDIGIIKFSATGQRLYSTYLGGTGNELPQSLIVSSDNELFLFGTTGSTDFPTSSTAYSRIFSGGSEVKILRNGISFTSGTDLFVSRFSENGIRLLASTFIGGSGNDGLNTASQLKYNYADEARGGIAMDGLNNVYVGCSTSSENFPVPGNAFQSVYGGGSQDGMLVKFNKDLTTLYWGTYLGGSSADGIYSLTINKAGTIYVAGGTVSTDFPTKANNLQMNNGGGQSDGFITGISPNGQGLTASTFYGSDMYDQIYLVSSDRQNNVYVYGQTEKGGSFYTENFTFSEPNGKQFISKFNPELTQRIWSTCFGSGLAKPDITPSAFTVDICGQIFIAGWGGASNSSPDGGTFGGTNGLTVTPDAFQPATDNNDFYLMVLKEDEQSLVYASFFGGETSSEHVDGGTSRFDKRGVMHQAVCAGCGGRDDFPTTPGVWSNVNGSSSGCNNAVFKFDFQLPATVASFTSPTIGCAPFAVDFSNSSSNAATYAWTVNGTAFSTDQNPNYLFNSPGLYTIRLVAENPTSCNVRDTFFKQIRVVNSTRDVFDSLEICYLSGKYIGPQFPIDPYYEVFWNPTEGLNEPTAQHPFATPDISTNYVLLLSLGSCADTVEQYISVRIDSTEAGPDLNICRGQTVQIGNPTFTGNYSTQWSPAEFLSDSSSLVPLASVDKTTTFYVLRIPNDSLLGCPARDSLLVSIPEGAPLANFETEVLATCTNVKVLITNTSELAEISEWNYGSGSGNFSPIVFNYGDTISITLMVSNAVCKDTLTLKQPIDDLTSYFSINSSNAFSPDGDGINDCFSPAMQNLPAPDDKNFLSCSTLFIYDRWGKKVFESIETSDGCWNGKSIGGEELPEGTYFFEFEGQGQKLKGTVTLRRS